jgi:50S ribosomal protein L16 3-hydroxylase
MSLVCHQGVALSDYQALGPVWQREPCFMGSAVDASALQVDPDDLVEIITQTSLPSRLITGAEGQDFTLEHGPFSAFTPPANAPWTVLIQAIEHLFPEFAALRDQLNWLPAWRFEDCMLSWASKGGSVGRHFDQFSVFLVQLHGRRHWDVGPEARADTPRVPDQPLALVARTEADASITAHPGDVLYVPPGVIHHGVAADPDCMTLSIGFRAPSVGDLLEGLLETADSPAEQSRFDDVGRTPTESPGEITADDIHRAREAIIQYLNDDQRVAQIFAERVTAPYLECASGDPLTDADVMRLIRETSEFELDCGVRVAYFETTLYINGAFSGQDIPSELVELANKRRIRQQQIQTLSPRWYAVIVELIQHEHLVPAEDSD